MMRTITLSLLTSLLLAGCGSTGWSDDTQAQFMKACTIKPQMKSYCQCSLKVAMDTFTEEEARNIHNLPRKQQVSFARKMLSSCRQYIAINPGKAG